MIAVVDKKVVKHLIDSDRGLLEVPIRVSFQYDLDNGRFVTGSMERQILYNEAAALRRLPGTDATTLSSDINKVVDQMLIEHLCYSNHASADVELYERETKSLTEPETRAESPKIILP
ncbi:MAG: hypothetical protein AAF525_04085 [Pseudomonadota bacterium]